jgi:hypothetical protein
MLLKNTGKIILSSLSPTLFNLALSSTFVSSSRLSRLAFRTKRREGLALASPATLFRRTEGRDQITVKVNGINEILLMPLHPIS